MTWASPVFRNRKIVIGCDWYPLYIKKPGFFVIYQNEVNMGRQDLTPQKSSMLARDGTGCLWHLDEALTQYPLGDEISAPELLQHNSSESADRFIPNPFRNVVLNGVETWKSYHFFQMFGCSWVSEYHWKLVQHLTYQLQWSSPSHALGVVNVRIGIPKLLAGPSWKLLSAEQLIHPKAPSSEPRESERSGAFAEPPHLNPGDT